MCLYEGYPELNMQFSKETMEYFAIKPEDLLVKFKQTAPV